MIKKILKKLALGVVSVVLVAGGAAMFAAFEAHVINVTAQIENALSVPVTPISFGTVFPQEKLFSTPFAISLSESFQNEEGVTSVEYVIKQKPKVRTWKQDIVLGDSTSSNGGAPANPDGEPTIPIEIVELSLAGIAPINPSVSTKLDSTVSSGDSFFDVFVEVDTPPADGTVDNPNFSGPAWDLCENYAPARNASDTATPNWVPDWSNLDNDWFKFCYPPLSPYLSKEAADGIDTTDGLESDDRTVAAFHNPYNPSSWARGTLTQSSDPVDTWMLDLDVPCFEGQCAQDWQHPGWELPPSWESQIFGTDLWIEVTNIIR